MFFDLEYNPRWNAQRDFNALVDALLNVVQQKLHTLYGTTLPLDKVVELDATTGGENEMLQLIATRLMPIRYRLLSKNTSRILLCNSK
jgi:hypothetical protein